MFYSTQHCLAMVQITPVCYWTILFSFIQLCSSCHIYLDNNGTDNKNCLTNSSNYTCKTLQYVFDQYSQSAGKDCSIHVFNNQTITLDNGTWIDDESNGIFVDSNYDDGLLTLSFPYDTRLYIIGENNKTDEVFISYNVSTGILMTSDGHSNSSIVWSNLHFIQDMPLLLLAFEDFHTVEFNNVVMSDLSNVKIENVSCVTINESLFTGKDVTLDIQNIDRMEVFETKFNNFGGILLTDVSNLLVDSCSFLNSKKSIFNCSNNGYHSPEATWQILSSNFSHNEVRDVMMSFEGMSVIFTDNEFNNNSVDNLLLITLTKQAYFQFLNNDVSLNNFDSFGLKVVKEDDAGYDNVTMLPPLIKIDNNVFDTNTGMSQRALIEVVVCSESQNFYTYNEFNNNTMPNMIISSGKNAFHNLSFSLFVSNIGLNLLVDFSLAKECKSEQMRIHLDGLQFTDNSFYITVDEDVQDPTVMSICSYSNHRPIEVSLGNIIFYQNYGTALTLSNVNVSLHGEMDFVLNSGDFGGALLLNEITLTINSDEQCEINFINNTAKYGGAVYILDNPCIEDWLTNKNYECNIIANFIDNSAVIEGDSIYSQLPHCRCFSNNCNFTFDHQPEIVSGAVSMNISADKNNQKPLVAFPGRNVSLNFTIADCAHTPVTCTAKPLALCGKDKPYSCAGHENGGFQFDINGPVYIHLQSGFVNTDSILSIDITGSNKNNTLSPRLYFQCRNHRGYEMTSATGNINVNISQDCPIGFSYNSETMSCECNNHKQNYICDFSSGKICVKKGIWAGNWYASKNETKLIVSDCKSAFCNNKYNKSCQINHLQDYIELNLETGYQNDERCVRGHSGLLCSQCQNGKTNSFDSYICIDDADCRGWHQYILLILSLVWPIILGFSLLFLTPETKYGVGNFYCPFFVLSVLGPVINRSGFDPYFQLQSLVNVYISTFLLGSKALAFIPWCFFDMGGQMWSTFYNYLGPIIIFLFLIIFVKSAQICSRHFFVLQSNPVKSMSITLVVTFWSLAQTSITLITPLEMSGLNTRLDIQPDQEYLREWHILMFLISLLVITGLTGASIFLLFSSVFQGRLIKIKPFLDEFQYSYKMKYRWFAGVYFTSWILLSTFHITHHLVVFRSLLFAVLILHCMCQPYESHWMNKVDMFLLIDLILIVSIEEDSMKHDSWGLNRAITYIAVIIPLLYITLGALYMISSRCYIILKKCYSLVPKKELSSYHSQPDDLDLSIRIVNPNRSNTTTTAVALSDSVQDNFEQEFARSPTETCLEREPLLFSVEREKRL